MRGVSPRGIPRRVLGLAANRRRFAELVERLRGSDVIVVVAHVPGSLARNALQNVEALRKATPEIPIVNYDLVYLPTVEKWGAAMLRGEASGLLEADLNMLVPLRSEWSVTTGILSRRWPAKSPCRREFSPSRASG